MTESWGDLLHELTCKVFELLEHQDRYNASLVCKNWSKAFNSPEIWKTLKPHHIGLQERRDENIMKMIEKVGYWVKDVSLHRFDTTKDATITMNKILNSLQQAKVTKFVLVVPNVYNYYKGPVEKVCWGILSESISRFLKTQTSLEWFDMNNYDISAPRGLDILENLSLASCTTLQHLNISHFFDSQSGVHGVHNVPAFRVLINRFTQLRSVKINYHCIDEDNILALAENCSETLQEVTLHIVQGESYLHTISSSTWKKVRSACPKLGIKLNLWLRDSSVIIRILTEGMPLRALWYKEYSYTGMFEEDDVLSETPIVNHLKNFTDTLEELYLTFPYDDDLISEELVNLVTACSKLKCLDYEGSMLWREVAAICEAQKEGKIKLQHCNLRVESSKDDIVRVREEYGPVFAAQNAKILIKHIGEKRRCDCGMDV